MYCTKQLLIISALFSAVFFSCDKKDKATSSDLVYEEIPVKEKKKEEVKKIVKKEKSKPIDVRYFIQEGTELSATPTKPISTEKVSTGDIVDLRLDKAIIKNRKEIVPKGTKVKAKVVLAQNQKKLIGRSKLHLELESLEMKGNSYALSSNVVKFEGKSNTGKTLAKAGAGAAAGTGVGAVSVKEDKGKAAGIGAAVGAAVGTGTALLQKKEAIVVEESIPFTTNSETRIVVQVTPY